MMERRKNNQSTSLVLTSWETLFITLDGICFWGIICPGELPWKWALPARRTVPGLHRSSLALWEMDSRFKALKLACNGWWQAFGTVLSRGAQELSLSMTHWWGCTGNETIRSPSCSPWQSQHWLSQQGNLWKYFLGIQFLTFPMSDLQSQQSVLLLEF